MKKRRLMILLLCVTLVFSGVGVWYWVQSENPPEQDLQKYDELVAFITDYTEPPFHIICNPQSRYPLIGQDADEVRDYRANVWNVITYLFQNGIIKPDNLPLIEQALSEGAKVEIRFIAHTGDDIFVNYRRSRCPAVTHHNSNPYLQDYLRIYNVNGKFFNVNINGVMQKIFAVNNGWIIYFSPDGGLLGAVPESIKYIRKVDNEWQSNILFRWDIVDRYSAILQFSEDGKQLVLYSLERSFTLPCQMDNDIEQENFQNLHDATENYRWAGDKYELIDKSYTRLRVMQETQDGDFYELEDWYQYCYDDTIRPDIMHLISVFGH